MLFKKGKASVILLHCTSIYPTPDSYISLNESPSLKEKFGLDVGFTYIHVGRPPKLETKISVKEILAVSY